MNTPVRRIAIAVMAMILLLMANLTYVQVVQAGDLRTDQRNQRVLLAEYSRQRGQISAQGQVLARSVPSEGQYPFQREYPTGPAFASPQTQIGSQQQVILHCQSPKHLAPLRYMANTQAHDGFGRMRSDLLPMQHDLPLAGRNNARNAVEQGGFTRAVGPNQRDNLTGPDLQRDFVEGLNVPIKG